MIRSRRSATRTLVLLRLAQACMRGGRLEMISVWLLFLRLLRATTGVKRPDGNEITEEERESTDQQEKEQENLSQAASMETSQLVEGKIHVEECQYSEDGPDAHFSKCLDTEKGICPTRDQDKSSSGTIDCENATEREGSALQQLEDLTIKNEEEDHKESVLPLESDQDTKPQSQPVKEETNSLCSSNAKETDYQEQRQPVEKETNSTMACNANETSLHKQGQPIKEETNTTMACHSKEAGLPEQGQPIKQETNTTMACNSKKAGLQDQPVDEETNNMVSCKAKVAAVQEQGQQMEEETKSTMSCSSKETALQEQDQPVEEETNSTMACNAKETGLQEQGQPIKEETNTTMACHSKEAGLPEQGQPIKQETNTTMACNSKKAGLQDQPVEEETNNTVSCEAKETALQEQDQPVEEETKSTMACNSKEAALQEQGQPVEEETKRTISCHAKEAGLQEQDQPVEEVTNSTMTCNSKESALQEQGQVKKEETNSTMACNANETALQKQDPPMEEETKSTMACNANETALQEQGQAIKKETNTTNETALQEQDPPVAEETGSYLSCEAKEADLQEQSQSIVEEANKVQGQSGENVSSIPSSDSCQLAEVEIKSTLAFDDQAQGQKVKEEPDRTLSFDDYQSHLPSKEERDSKEVEYQAQSQRMKEDDSNTCSVDAKEKDHQVQEESNRTLSFDAKNIDNHVQDPTVEDETSRTLSYNAKEDGEKVDNIQSSLDPKMPDHQEPQEPPGMETESALERQIKELAISEASTESCHDNDRDDLSDCLHVEMAIVSSDSDNEEQWKSMFSPVVDEDEFDGILESDINKEIINQDQATEDDVTSLSEHKTEPDPMLATENLDILEQAECPTECDLEDSSYNSIHYSSLSKIPEDEEMPFKHSLQRLSASTSELDKAVPRDYCVIQDMKSENISTEHLDFKMARQQWQKMEKQTKGQVLQPTVKQETCQGGHSLMYTPVRNLERSKRDLESDSLSLSLGDYQYTQFSPSSDDSGLDDASYRSHYDEPETPVEREIRETMEREESFRRERAMSRPCSDDPMMSKARPVTLLPSKADLDSKKVYNTREDRCRSQRPSSAKSPTLSFSPSPSPKSTYQEMVAKNVIILEPDSHPPNPRHKKNNLLSPVTSRFHEWPSDTSNVIVLETANLIIRSVSEFCLNTACQETQESTFHNNPFFKLRSHSTQSLVDQEIKEVRQRDEEFRRQRALLYTKEQYDTVLVSPSSPLSFTYDKPGGTPAKCKSSPSSPLRVRKMDRSTLSCDQKFPEAPVFHRVRRKSTLVQRWEAAVFANQQHHV